MQKPLNWCITKTHMRTRKLTRWWSQASVGHAAFGSVWFSGTPIGLLGKETPLPGDLDTRIDTPKPEHTVGNKSLLCVEKIKLWVLYTCKPPLAQSYDSYFSLRLKKKKLLNMIYFSPLKKKKEQDSVSLISLHMYPLQSKLVSSK